VERCVPYAQTRKSGNMRYVEGRIRPCLSRLSLLSLPVLLLLTLMLRLSIQLTVTPEVIMHWAPQCSCS
jgi:hypothetical protein